MKTSCYDDGEEDVDDYLSYEAATSESSETTYEAAVVEGHEAAFAKCKVAQIPESEKLVDSFETSFAKCSITAGTERHDEQTVNYEEPVADSYEATIIETNEEPVVRSNEVPTSNVTVQIDNYTPSMPPPVPKRTLLPSKPKKEASVVPEAVKSEISVVTEEAESQNVAYRDIELVSPEDVTQKTETGAERWSDSTSVSLPGQVEDIETVSSDPGNAQCEPASEMYYTASSEVSLLSDTELAEKVQNEEDEPGKDDRKNVIAGHVAAMRERFESMTRTNTPCPDLVRSLSPSLEVFRNLSPSPDRLS